MTDPKVTAEDDGATVTGTDVNERGLRLLLL